MKNPVSFTELPQTYPPTHTHIGKPLYPLQGTQNLSYVLLSTLQTLA